MFDMFSRAFDGNVRPPQKCTPFVTPVANPYTFISGIHPANHMVRSMYSGENGHERVSDEEGCVPFFWTAPCEPRSAANAAASLVGWKN